MKARLPRFCLPWLALSLSPLAGHAGELIVNGAFDTDRPVSLSGFVSRQDAFSAFPKLLGTSMTNVGWYVVATGDFFEVWQAGFFGNPAGFGQHLELRAQSYIYQDFVVGQPGSAVFSFLYTRGLSGPVPFSVSIGAPGAAGANNGSLLTPIVVNPTGPFSAFDTFSLPLPSVAPGTYRVSFLDFAPTLATPSSLVDEVSFQFTPVPEPGTWTLLLAGILGGALICRRRGGRHQAGRGG